jgi:2-phosphosulfolactate phosphatase
MTGGRGHPAHRQDAYGLRFDWGLPGLLRVAAGHDVDLVVVVDVLSFTTTVSVALDVGTAVLPYPWRDGDGARRFAAEHAAVLAAGRSTARPGQVSLSPVSLRTGTPPPRVVLPSPNGATLAFAAARQGVPCVASSLRCARAVGRWVAGTGATRVAVVAAGELDGDSLRPAAEDLWGAGATVAALAAYGCGPPSPEAQLAADAYAAVRGRETAVLRACASGRELVDGGFPADVDTAAEVDASAVVPLLVDGAFVDAR